MTAGEGQIRRIEEAVANRQRKSERLLDDPYDINDTDIANAKRLVEKHGRDIRYTPERGWLVWDGKRWGIDEKSLQMIALAKTTAVEIFDELKEAPDRDLLFKHAKRSQSKNAVQAMEWLARSAVPARITDFDADPWALNVSNGTLNLRTGELREHNRGDLTAKLAPVEYHSTAECPLWLATLERIFDRDREVIEYVRRLVGYALTGLSVEQVIHFLWGMGANGKSTVSDLLLEMLGDYAVVCSPDLIMTRRHGGIPNDVARLRGVRLAIMNETGQGGRFDEAKLKDLTGGDKLTARFLHAEFFDFRPTHKLLIRGNHKPAITGTDEGIWRRLRLIPFTVVIPPEERNPYLLDQLRAELPGVLRWAVEGCLAWQRDKLNPPAAVLTAVSTYRDEADTLGRFIEECCAVRNLAQVKASVFQKAYATFCREADERPIPSKDLPAELERRGYRYQRTNSARLYLGLELTMDDGPGYRWYDRD
jgi:putative DNA primase/helicase